MDRSFENFKELLLTHSVQRPPFSIGLFTFTEMKAIMAWALDTYYRHYKLYMYAFTDRCVGQLGGKSATTALRLFVCEVGCLIGCERQWCLTIRAPVLHLHVPCCPAQRQPCLFIVVWFTVLGGTAGHIGPLPKQGRVSWYLLAGGCMLLACCRVLMNVTQVHPLDTVEFAPSLPPLSEAMTEEQHNEVLEEEQAKV